MDHPPEQNNTFLNLLLSICVTLFAFIETLTFNEIYNCLFKCLTLFSIVLIIIINIPKAYQVIKSIFIK